MVFTTSIKHPKEFFVTSGSTDLSKEIESINQSISLILTSSKGELFGDPEYGSNLYGYIYDLSGSALYCALRTEIVDCLSRQESRIVVNENDISFEESEFTLKIKIGYTIRYTNFSAESTVLIKKEENQWVI